MVFIFLKSHRTVKVQMEDGTQRTARMVEGSGVYACHIHEFITEDLNEFRMHEKTVTHFQINGASAPCVICKKKVDLSGKPTDANPVCDECEGRLLKSQESARTRMAEAKRSVKK